MTVGCSMQTVVALAKTFGKPVPDVVRLLDKTAAQMATKSSTHLGQLARRTPRRWWSVAVVARTLQREGYDFLKLTEPLLVHLQGGASFLLIGVANSSFTATDGRAVAKTSGAAAMPALWDAEVVVRSGVVHIPGHSEPFPISDLRLAIGDHLRRYPLTLDGAMRTIAHAYYFGKRSNWTLPPIVSASAAEVARIRRQDQIIERIKLEFFDMPWDEELLPAAAWRIARAIVDNALGGDEWVTHTDPQTPQSRMGTLGEKAFVYLYQRYLQLERTLQSGTPLLFYDVGSGYLMVAIAMALLRVPVRGCERSTAYHKAGEIIKQPYQHLFGGSISIECCSFEAATPLSETMLIYVNSLAYRTTAVGSQEWLCDGLSQQASGGGVVVLSTDLIPGLGHLFSTQVATAEKFGALHGSGATATHGESDDSEAGMFSFYESSIVVAV